MGKQSYGGERLAKWKMEVTVHKHDQGFYMAVKGYIYQGYLPGWVRFLTSLNTAQTYVYFLTSMNYVLKLLGSCVYFLTSMNIAKTARIYQT